MSMGHRLMYYHLLFNHNTHTNDTIKAASKAELISGVTDVTDDSTPCGGIIVLGLLISIVLIALVLLAKHKIESIRLKNKQW